MSTEVARVLVVDDNPASLYSTSRVLRGAGLAVVEATTGGEALQAMEQDTDLVVLDVNLPDMDGFEVCRRIRANERTARIPVIHLSATFINDTDKVQGYESGADGYLTHPIEPPVLIATVRAFLRTRNAERQREEALQNERAARQEAELANRLKDDFLATLSHELRTPLNAIVGWAQLLKMGNMAPEELAEAVDAIDRNARAQAQMIADLLDVSRIRSGKLRLDMQPLDPSSVVDAALNAIAPAADSKGVRIERSLAADGSPVAADPFRLQQVIWNLVNNAVKFTPSGGTVRVMLRRAGSAVEFIVSDDGEGIPPNLLSQIFDRFQQGDASTTRKHGGLGIGLSIAKQLVELHGGHIRAESAGQGQGATFTVALPVAGSSLPRSQRKAASIDTESHSGKPEPSISLSGIRVLIVDDDPDARSLLKRIAVNHGAEAYDAGGVSQALAAISEFRPEILVSDLGMPVQDGFDLIREVRSRGYSFQDLPAIALTAFARGEDRRQALMAGFQVHIAKPVDPLELVATIATLVGRTG